MVNRVQLMGYLGRDPECKTTSNDSRLATFSLATSSRYKEEDKTEWHRIVCWGKNADVAERFLNKGNLVFVEGRMETRSWDDKASGQKRYMTEVVVHKLTLMPKGMNVVESERSGASVSSSADNDIPF